VAPGPNGEGYNDPLFMVLDKDCNRVPGWAIDPGDGEDV